jgi:DNA polymerase III subunit epsilon
MSSLLPPRRFCVVDLETTGMTATADRITEVGMVSVVNGRVVDEWSSLVNPECAIPGEIQAITGITNDMVKDAPTFAEIASQIRVRMEGAVFVAHNARFDYGFLKHEFRRLGESFTADVLCTVRLSRRLYPEYGRHGLDQLRDRHLLSFDGRHRALGDARTAWQFVNVAIAEHGQATVDAAMKAILKMPSLPPQLAPGVLDDLPEAPGVYTFYGVNDLPIYIGKSINLRDRIRSHFSSDYRSANDMRLSTEIMRIEVEQTAGEIGALLREMALIKSRMPLRNHRLRRNDEVVFVRLRQFDLPPEYVPAHEINFGSVIDASDAHVLYGPFSSKSQAKRYLNQLSGEFELCWHVVDTKMLPTACFGHQIRRCRGVCVGTESLAQHNLRLIAALADKRLPDWPFAGRIAVCESRDEVGGDTNTRKQWHVFERWCFVGSANDEHELEMFTASPAQPFDADVYKLLGKVLTVGAEIRVLHTTSSTQATSPQEAEDAPLMAAQAFAAE